MEELENIVNRCKNKKSKPKNNKKIKKNVTLFLLSVIFLFSCLIYTKISDENKENFKNIFLTNSLSFTKINNIYEKYFGEVLPSVTNAEMVFSQDLNYKEITDYHEGEKLTLQSQTVISSLIGGIVVFIGEKDNYGNTVIVQGNDGYDIWYGNVTDINVNVYDYIEKGTTLGQSIDENVYILIKKGEETIKYEDYKN